MGSVILANLIVLFSPSFSNPLIKQGHLLADVIRLAREHLIEDKDGGSSTKQFFFPILHTQLKIYWICLTSYLST